MKESRKRLHERNKSTHTSIVTKIYNTCTDLENQKRKWKQITFMLLRTSNIQTDQNTSSKKRAKQQKAEPQKSEKKGLTNLPDNQVYIHS